MFNSVHFKSLRVGKLVRKKLLAEVSLRCILDNLKGLNELIEDLNIIKLKTKGESK